MKVVPFTCLILLLVNSGVKWENATSWFQDERQGDTNGSRWDKGINGTGRWPLCSCPFQVLTALDWVSHVGESERKYYLIRGNDRRSTIASLLERLQGFFSVNHSKKGRVCQLSGLFLSLYFQTATFPLSAVMLLCGRSTSVPQGTNLDHTRGSRN